jgi:transcriptional regulator with XRE-family HTH domain
MTQIGRLVRDARRAAELSQGELAERAGTTQGVVSAIEKGTRAPSIPMVERLLEAAGCALELATAPLWERIDAMLDRASATPQEERLADVAFDLLRVERAWPRHIAHVWAGCGAALLHGVPVAVPRWDVLTPDVDADGLWGPLIDGFMTPLNGPGSEHVDVAGLRVPFRVSATAALPEAVPIVVGGTIFPVAALHEVEVADPDVARILTRLRTRLASNP